MPGKKKLSFEEQLAQVESMIGRMEQGSLPLEETIQAYEQGMEMLNAMEKELTSATQRLTVLRQAADGTETEEPLTLDGIVGEEKL